MADIFDEIASGVSSSSPPIVQVAPDIFDQVAASTPEPTFLQNVWSDIKSTPAAVGNVIMSIPQGVSNVVHLPGDLYNAGIDAKNLAISELFGGPFIPRGTPEESAAHYGRAERTLRGVETLGLGAAGGKVLNPVLGTAAGISLADKLNQAVGIDNPTTAAEDAAKLRTNLVQGGLLSGAFSLGGKLLGAGADATTLPPPEDAQIQSLGINPSDIKKANKYKAVINGETPIERAIQGATDRGVFNGDPSPAKIDLRNEAAINSIGEELHGPTGLLKAADEAILNKNVPEVPTESLGWWQSLDDYVNGKNSATTEGATKVQAPLSLPRAASVIADNPFQAETLGKQLANRVETINKEWDGTLSGLSRLKSKIGKIGYSGTTDSKVLDQAIASDLRDTIEARANEVSPGLGDQVAALNQQMSEHYTLRPILEKAKNKELQLDFKAPINEPGIMRQTLGGAAKGAALGAGAGYVSPLTTLPGMLAGATAGSVYSGGKALLGKTANSVQSLMEANPEAISLISSLFSKGSNAANTISKIAPLIEVAPKEDTFSSIFTRKEPMKEKANNVKLVENLIDANPYYSALYQAESGRNPEAKNPKSSAKGGFQFIDSTAKAVGLEDPLDLAKSFEAVQKLTNEHKAKFGEDPKALYAAHYLGATLLDKVLNGKTLSSKEAQQVEDFNNVAWPHFERIYATKVDNNSLV